MERDAVPTSRSVVTVLLPALKGGVSAPRRSR